MSKEKREEFHKAEELRAKKRDEDQEHDFAACHGKYAWICLKCKTINPASSCICMGNVRVKIEDRAYGRRSCGAVQSGEHFGGLAPERK